MEKKEFEKAEVEEIRFEDKEDIVTASNENQTTGPIGGDDMTEE